LDIFSSSLSTSLSLSSLSSLAPAPSLCLAVDHDSDAEEDDVMSPRRKVSIGEELWEVHVKRSSGLPDDADEDAAPGEGEEDEEDGARKRLKTDDDELLTAPLDVLLAESPGTASRKKRDASKKGKEVKEEAVFERVSRKVAGTRNY
jgi:hypothetical protein